MKTVIKALIVAAAMCLFVNTTASAAEAISIAVVDVNRLVANSKAGKDIQAQLEKQKGAFLSEIQKQEQKLRDDEKVLADQRSKLSQEEFVKKAKEFEAALTETRRKAQERKKKLEDSATAGLQKLKDEINKVVQEISAEKKYDMVLNSQNVVVSNKSIDITDDALARLDKNISQIPLQASN